MTDFEKFMKLVEEMRTAQKDYFKSKQYHTLDKARGLERAVDLEIKNSKNQNNH